MGGEVLVPDLLVFGYGTRFSGLQLPKWGLVITHFSGVYLPKWVWLKIKELGLRSF